MSDNVNNPAHYNAGSVETIEGIRAALGEGFADYCKGNVLKYVWRCGKKGDGVEDLRKAATYLQWAIEAMEGNCPVMPDSSDQKPLAIPAGWRELEPDEVPLASDMHEWMGGWFYRNDDATNEYKWHGSRHVRKIETANTSETPNSSIHDPGEGYRTPHPGDVGKQVEVRDSEDTMSDDARWVKRTLVAVIAAPVDHTDRHNIGTFVAAIQGRDAKHICHVWRFSRIKKGPTETANPSETPNSSTWIPKVGDKVRVVTFGRIASRYECVVTSEVDGKYTVEHLNLVSKNLEAKELQLIEVTP